MYHNLLPSYGLPCFLYTKTETSCEICSAHHGIVIAELGAQDAALERSRHSGSSLGPATGADGLASGPVRVTGSDQQTFRDQ